jgi:two-component system chemotaxis response regulator CheB
MSSAPQAVAPACILIGASAGGVEALGHLLPRLPAGLAIPVCVVLHLPPQSTSLLPQIFAGRCAVPVKEIEDGEPLCAGGVYFAAPNYHFLIDTGPRVALSVDDPVHFSRPSIDVLFLSGADVFGAATCALLLSGSNQDGAEGLRSIAERGGTVMIQDPQEAQAPEMALAALALLPGHPVMRLAQMAEWLARLPRAAEAGE